MLEKHSNKDSGLQSDTQMLFMMVDNRVNKFMMFWMIVFIMDSVVLSIGLDYIPISVWIIAWGLAFFISLASFLYGIKTKLNNTNNIQVTTQKLLSITDHKLMKLFLLWLVVFALDMWYLHMTLDFGHIAIWVTLLVISTMSFLYGIKLRLYDICK